jgi:catechol 2,3-dioxygenase-like lactoylglutathione lyase family enzyme
MTIKKLDHVSVVVVDLEDAIAFFTALGMTIEGRAPIEGKWVDRINAIDNIRVDIVMMRTPDGSGRLELTKFHHPELVALTPAVAPPNAPGLRSVMLTVVSVDDTVARLQALLHAGPGGHHRFAGRGAVLRPGSSGDLSPPGRRHR